MFGPLKPASFPLMNIGSMVYAKDRSSPIIVADSIEQAEDFVRRLNRDQLAALVSPEKTGA